MSDGLSLDPQSLLDERALVAAMLRQEAALAQAQADLGLLAVGDAQSIINTCKVDLFDALQIIRDSQLLDSHTAEPPIIKSLRASVHLFNPTAAQAVYRVGQAQDLLANALALVTHELLRSMTLDMQALHKVPAMADVCQAWSGVQAAAQRALCLNFKLNPELPKKALQRADDFPLAALQARAAEVLTLNLANTQGPEAWMSLGCELGVLMLCVQRVQGQDSASRAPLWVAQWLTELAPRAQPSPHAGVGRDFWRAEWPLWTTLAGASAHAVRALRAQHVSL